MGSEVLRQAYRNPKNQINRENDWLKRDYFSRKIYENDGNIKGTWKIVNKLIDRRSKTTEIPYLDVGGAGGGGGGEGGEIVSDLKHKVENLNDYFVSAGSALNSRFPGNTHVLFKQHQKRPTQSLNLRK